MRSVLHDPVLEEELLDVGYVTVPMLDADEVAAFGAALDALRPDDKFSPDGAGPLPTTYHCTFLDSNVEYKRLAQKMIEELFEPKLSELLVDYRILTGNFYVKAPGKGRFQIHQNWPTTEDLSVTTLTVWCPLDDTDVANGALRVVPGSHKLLPDVATAQSAPFFAEFEQALVERHLVPVPLRAGEALVFDDSLVHWSGDNCSAAPRRAVQIETLPAEVPPVIYHLVEHGGRPHWELLGVDGSFFVENSLAQVFFPPADIPRLGTAEFRNRDITEAEFAALLHDGSEIRRRVYAGHGWSRGPHGAT